MRHESSATFAVSATPPAPASGSDCASAPGCESDWFYGAVLGVCGRKDPGYQLHLFTRWPLSSCRAFCARDADQRRRPAPDFLRLLLRSEHGEPFFAALMGDSTARWYADLRDAERRAHACEARLRAIAGLVAGR